MWVLRLYQRLRMEKQARDQLARWQAALPLMAACWRASGGRVASGPGPGLRKRPASTPRCSSAHNSLPI